MTKKTKKLQNIAALRVIETKKVEARAMIEKYYLDHDLNKDGTLSKDEIALLLKKTCQPGVVPSELAMEETLAKIPAECWTKDQLGAEFVKLRGFLDQQIYIDKTFAEFDTDGTGLIGRDELAVLMQRMAGGVDPPASDVDFVLKTCDVGKGGWGRGGGDAHRVSDGEIDRDEIIPVISVWKHILIERVKGNDPVAAALKSKSRACVVS